MVEEEEEEEGEVSRHAVTRTKNNTCTWAPPIRASPEFLGVIFLILLIHNPKLKRYSLGLT